MSDTTIMKKEAYKDYKKFILSNPGIVLDPVAESKMLTQFYQRLLNGGEKTNASKENSN